MSGFAGGSAVEVHTHMAKEPASRAKADARVPNAAPGVRAFDDAPDETLADLLLEQGISDRLRSLSNYVNALARFRPV
jgi:hypothetical protein